MKLLQELFAQGVISEEKLSQFVKLVEESGKKEEEIILENRIVTEETLFNLKSKVYKVDLQKVQPEQIPSDILGFVPEEASVNYKMSAISRIESKDKTRADIIMVGMVYPEDIVAQNALRFLANEKNFNYRVCLITPRNLADILKQRRNISAETREALKQLNQETDEISLARESTPKTKAQIKTISEDAPIIKMVLVVLRHAVEGNASDIHIEPQRDKLNIRFRLNGMLHSSLSLPLKVHAAVVARIKILSNLKIDESRMPQDGRFSAKINNKDIDFRVSTFPTLYGEKIEIRVLDTSVALKSFEELGLAGRNLEIVKTAIKKPYGMILLTGSTGSGKTTTQYAILRSLNQDNVNIVTVEDPIEYAILGVNQSQVKPEIGYTFARGLRQILRQDPNVIMVGEIRDEETADLAVNAALTGHIVLSTLHTNSSVGVVPRLIDMGVKAFLIPSAVKLVISQRLVRVLCPECKIRVRPDSKTRAYILEKVKSIPRKEIDFNEEAFSIYESKGCDGCGFTGYKGRVGLFEVLPMSDELAELIQKNPLEALILKIAQKQGMLTMEQEGIIKVIKGQTSVEEIIRAAEEI